MSDALSRRGFLGLAGTLGVAALTGCGSGGQAAAQPKQGGRLRAVYAEEPGWWFRPIADDPKFKQLVGAS